MEDEFDQLMRYFSLDQREKEQKLDEIFKCTTEFFQRYKYIMGSGTEGQKKDIQEKMSALKEKLNRETQIAKQETGVSPEEVKTITNDAKHFTPKQWETIQRIRSTVKQEESEQQKQSEERKEDALKNIRKKHKKRKKKTRSNWLKS